MEEVRSPVLGSKPTGSEQGEAGRDVQVPTVPSAPLRGEASFHLEQEAREGESVATVPQLGGPVQSEPGGESVQNGLEAVEAGPEGRGLGWVDWRSPKPRPKKPDAKERLRRESERLARLRDAARVVNCKHCARHIHPSGKAGYRHGGTGKIWCTPPGVLLPKQAKRQRAEPA